MYLTFREVNVYRTISESNRQCLNFVWIIYEYRPEYSVHTSQTFTDISCASLMANRQFLLFKEPLTADHQQNVKQTNALWWRTEVSMLAQKVHTVMALYTYNSYCWRGLQNNFWSQILWTDESCEIPNLQVVCYEWEIWKCKLLLNRTHSFKGQDRTRGEYCPQNKQRYRKSAECQ